MSAEPERVRQRHVHPPLDLPVGRGVEVALGIGRELVDGGRNDAAGGATAARRRTPARPPPPSRCPVMDLVEPNTSLRACSPKTAFTASVSAMSPCCGGGAVRVDVAHVLGIDLAVGQAGAHGPLGALAVLRRRGDVVGVAAEPVARAPRPGSGRPARSACSRLSSTTIAPPSPSTKPSRSLSNGRLAVSGESLRVESAFMFGERRHGEAGDGRLGAAGDHGVGHAVRGSG